MGSRYLVTGVQLGILLGSCGSEENKPEVIYSIINDIRGKQYIGNSLNNIEDDVKELESSLKMIEKGKVYCSHCRRKIAIKKIGSMGMIDTTRIQHDYDKEFEVTGMCPNCQDKVFNLPKKVRSK